MFDRKKYVEVKVTQMKANAKKLYGEVTKYQYVTIINDIQLHILKYNEVWIDNANNYSMENSQLFK